MTELQPISDTLARLEDVVDRGLGTFMEVGAALLGIRDSGKYRERGYDRFDVYCEGRFHLSRSRLYQLMDAAQVAEAVSTIVDTEAAPLPRPANEAQARELARLPDAETQRETWAEVVTEHPDPKTRTADTIGKVVDRRLGIERPAKAAPVRAVAETGADFPEDAGEPPWECPSCHRRYEADVTDCPECQPAFWPDEDTAAVPDVTTAAPPPVAPREQASAEQAKSDDLLGKAGAFDTPVFQQAHILRLYCDAEHPIRSGLLHLDPEAVAEALGDNERPSAYRLIRDTRIWLDRLEHALGRGLHVIEGGKVHG